MSFRSALSHRSFRSLWLAQLTSRIGDSVHEIALIWVVFETTGDPTLLSAAFVASFLPTAVFSLPAGVLVDRVNRTYLMVGSDIFRGAVVLTIPLYGQGPLLVPLILVVAVVTGTTETVFRPARLAITPKLVPDDDLDSANSLTELTFSVSQLLFAVGGVVVAVSGSLNAFYVDAGSFFLSAILLTGVGREAGEPEPNTDDDESPDSSSLIRRSLDDIRSGIRFVRERPSLQGLIVLLAGLKLTVAPVNVAAPVFATELPIQGSLAVGFVYTALFSGMSVGSLVVSRYDSFVDRNRPRVITVGLASFGVSLAAAVSAPGVTSLVVPVLALFAVAGLLFAAVRVPATTLSQVLVPDETRGRYMSISNAVTTLAFTAGLAAAGPLVELVGASTLMVVVSTFSVILGVLFYLRPIFQTTVEGQSAGVDS